MLYPKISVITLTKNNIKELENTVNSVLNQDLNVFIEILSHFIAKFRPSSKFLMPPEIVKGRPE